MGLFSRKPAYCTICNKQITAHKYKAKREWYGVKSPLCSDCHLDLDFSKKRDFCGICGNKLGFIRYNPKNHWKIKGQLCKNCWDEQKAQLDKK